MYLPYEDWLDQAKALKEGTRVRVDHTCGSGKTMIVSHDSKGYSARCFRCNIGGSQAHGERRISDIDFVRLRRADDQLLSTPTDVLVLPDDFVLEIPESAATWLYRAGIFAETARANRFGYSESMARVVLPVYEDGRLVYLQARATDKWRKPKYLNLSAVTKGAILWKGVHDYEQVVITEDILSALRVSLLGVSACSTLGTSVSDGQAGYLSSFKHVAFWYDGDPAGIKGAISGMNKMRMVTRTSTIKTTEDPKCYSNREITAILEEQLHGRN